MPRLPSFFFLNGSITTPTVSLRMLRTSPSACPARAGLPTSGDHAITVSLNRRSFRTAAPTFKGAVTGAAFDTEIGGHEVSQGFRYGF